MEMEDFPESLNKRKNKEKDLLSSRKRSLPTGLRLKPKILSAVDAVAKEAGMTRSEWLRQAVMRALKNWNNPLENPTIWPPCRHCGKRHDPNVHN